MGDEFDRWFEEPSAARCAVHAARPAELACGRCGAFQCSSCLDERERGLCTGCAEVVLRARLPHVTQSIAWKLVLAPAFALVSAGLLLARHDALPPLLGIWLVPVACAVAVLLTRQPVFGWLGVASSLGVLGYQAATAIDEHAWLLVSDVAMLAIAPLAASWGCLALSRQRSRLM
jgi:hypothetical protein